MKSSGRYLFLLLFLSASYVSVAQIPADKYPNLSDTVEIESILPLNGPRIAFIYSALFPGLGQGYNHKYWKMPIVYGGFIGLGYMVSYYNDRYSDFKTDLYLVLEDSNYIPASGATESQLRNLIDRARRERDNMIVMTAGFYILQIVDAHVDAHLREFDVNPDLKLLIEPSLEPTISSMSVGIGINLRF